ncbi:hypothetical protein SAMN04489835_5868 [Mycolicibacterium rutilum]|uniref:Uncharacterized protein n=1 Tax=Mycolicibacterium rutilum TaxID=370526 RepID=A0A1H6LWX8_MYCRU|nr:hypothetical protein [Mycolicibacterium rutilum]SEH93288.1 hypothetical protein SAMN04489835_5868 [Mycolicibacterium rutilum]
MAAPTQAEPEPPAAAPPQKDRSYTLARIIFRWSFIGVLTVFAFWDSFGSLVETTRGSGLNGYIWIIPTAAILAAQGVARQPRTELPIHDRQTDIILGTMGLVFALLLHGVLLQRYALHFHLLRLDFLALWVFVLSSAIILFGLRPVSRFVWVWALAAMIFALPYHIMVILLGGNRIAAGAATLVIAATATGIAVSRSSRRGWIGYFSAYVVGFVLLAIMAWWTPYAPVWVYQAVPALLSTAIVGLAMFLIARRGAPKRPMDRKVEPLAAGQIVRALPLVLVVAILLSLVKLPAWTSPPAPQFNGLQISGPLNPPAGFHVADTEIYPWVQRLYGRISYLTRQQMVADAGNPEWDKDAKPRTVMVDNVITDRPFSFNVYPTKVLYDATATRLSTPRRIDLGYGVTGEMVSVVDDHLMVTWNMLQWMWRNSDRAQRIVLITVDNHEDSAPFPEPNGALLPTLSTLLTVLFRGNSAVNDDNPTFKDVDLLTTFGRGMVAAQLQPLGRLQ